MKPRRCLALVVTSVLALGCASANAQDGEGNAPAPKADTGKRRPPEGFDAEKAKRAMTEHIAEIEKKIQEIEKSDAPETERRIAELRRAADDMRARIDELNRGVMPDFAGGGPGPKDEQRMREAEERMRDAERRAADAKVAVERLTTDGLGPNHPQMVTARRSLEDAVAALHRTRDEMVAARVDDLARGADFGGRRMHDRGERRGRLGRDDRGPGGPGPSVEERLAQLERAVREMHEMFARHDVPPEMRERAEREIRERRGEGGPGRRPAEVLAGRLDGGDPRPLDPNAPGRPPVPRPPRLGVVLSPGGTTGALARVEWSAADADELRRKLEAVSEQAQAQMRAAHDQMAEMKRQLADAQTELKRALAEIEAMRAQQPK